MDAVATYEEQQRQQQRREGSCCDAQKGDSSCCSAPDAGASGIAPGAAGGTAGGSSSFAPWLHTRGVWATFQESPMRPAGSAQLLPEQLVRKAAEAVRSSRDDPVVMLLLSGETLDVWARKARAYPTSGGGLERQELMYKWGPGGMPAMP